MNAPHPIPTGPETARQKPATLIWDDPFLLENQLSEEERMIRDAAHAYCQDGLLRRAQLYAGSQAVRQALGADLIDPEKAR